MFRALMTSAFMAVLLWWLQWEFRKKVSLTKYWQWFLAALLVQAAAGIASLVISDRVIGNLLYHGVGGGVTSTLLFIYLLKTYGQKYSWRVEVAVLYCFVSALGTLNELAEYAGEFATHIGMFSWDSHDTWRDLTANTTGALVAWLLYRICTSIAKTSDSRVQ